LKRLRVGAGKIKWSTKHVTRKDTGKVTMEGLLYRNAISDGTIPDHRCPLSLDWHGRPKLQSLSQERVNLRTSNLAGTLNDSQCTSEFCTHIQGSIALGLSEQKSIKMSGKEAVRVVRDSRKFSWQPYIWRITRSSFRELRFLVNQC